jgi:hypothetical protein
MAVKGSLKSGDEKNFTPNLFIGYLSSMYQNLICGRAVPVSSAVKQK